MKFAGGADEEDQAGAMHLASRLALAVRPSGAAGVGGACCLALAVRLCAAGGGALGVWPLAVCAICPHRHRPQR